MPMSMLLPFLTVSEACNQVETWIRESLAQAGLRVVPTFDLQIARLAHPDCSCPHHGTEQCSCQLVILLVYGKDPEPVTLVIHGQDGKTWVSFAASLEGRSQRSFETSVRELLLCHGSELSVADD